MNFDEGKNFKLQNVENVAKKTDNKWETSLLIIFIMIIVGLICQGVATAFVILIDRVFPFSSPLNELVKFITIDKSLASINANIYLLLVSAILSPGYILFVLIIKLFKSMSWIDLFDQSYYRHLKLCLALLTIIIVIFGFFPLLFELILVDEKTMEVLQGITGAIMLGSLFPYFYILIDDALINMKSESVLKNEKNGGWYMVDRSRKTIESRFETKEKNKASKHAISNTRHKWDEGYVSKHHLIYLLVIASVFIVVLLSLLFQDSIYAGSMLSFAATLSSILLAVIAIIITLLDVAGQRSNILDVKNSVEELKTVRSEIISLIEDFEEKSEKSSELVISALDVFRESNKEDIESAIEKIEEIISSTSDTSEPFKEEKVNGIRKDLEEALERLNHSSKAQVLSNERKKELLSKASNSMKGYKMNFKEIKPTSENE